MCLSLFLYVLQEYVGARASWGPPAPDVPLEEPWELTAASGGQLAAAAGTYCLSCKTWCCTALLSTVLLCSAPA